MSSQKIKQQKPSIGTHMGCSCLFTESAGASCTTVTYDETTYTIAVPNELRFEETVVAQHEGVPLATQPKIRAYDTNVRIKLEIEKLLWMHLCHTTDHCI